MQKRFLFCILLAATLSLSGCKDDYEGLTATTEYYELGYELPDLGNGIYLRGDGSEPATFRVVTNGTQTPWHFTGLPEWLSLTPSEGTGDTEITATATANPSPDEARQAYITLSSTLSDYPRLTTELIATQGTAAGFLLLNPESMNFPAEGGTQELTVESNFPWEVANVPDWMTVTPESGEAGTTAVTVTAHVNELDSERSGSLYFSNRSEYQYLYAAQEGFIYTILLNPDNLTFDAQGGSQTMTVTANFPWRIDGIPDWFSVSPRSGSAGTTDITLTADMNGEGRRYEFISFYNGLTDRLETTSQISQEQAEISVSPKSLEYSHTGETQYVTVTSTGDWEAESTGDWVIITPDSGHAGTTQVKIWAGNSYSTLCKVYFSIKNYDHIFDYADIIKHY